MSDTSITLAAAIGPNDEHITVSAAGTSHTAPFVGVIDSEAILFEAGTDGTAWRGRRGAVDTKKAAHAINATITIVSPPSLDRTGNVAALDLTLALKGVAAGYKVARGVHTQVAASDTVVTGLTTVVAAVASFQSAPTIKQLFCTADVGDQSGAPAAGSILIATLKPTATGNVTPTAATDFTDNLKIAWIAVGT